MRPASACTEALLLLRCPAGRSENQGGGASSNVVDMICPPGWDRVDWSTEIVKGHSPPGSDSPVTTEAACHRVACRFRTINSRQWRNSVNKVEFSNFWCACTICFFLVFLSQKSAIFSVTCHQRNLFLRPPLPFFRLSSWWRVFFQFLTVHRV